MNAGVREKPLLLVREIVFAISFADHRAVGGVH